MSLLLLFNQGGDVPPPPPPVQQRIGGDDAPLRRRKQRDFEDERRQRDELREKIVAAVAPLKAKKAEVVETGAEGEEGVAILTRRQRIAIPVPPAFDAAEVAKMVKAALDEVGIAVRQAESERARQLAAEALEAERLRLKRRREEEWLLLLN